MSDSKSAYYDDLDYREKVRKSDAIYKSKSEKDLNQEIDYLESSIKESESYIEGIKSKIYHNNPIIHAGLKESEMSKVSSIYSAISTAEARISDIKRALYIFGKSKN